MEDDRDDKRPYQVQARDGQTWWYDKGAIEVSEQDVTKNESGDIVRKGSAEMHNGGFTGLKPSQVWYCGKYRVSFQNIVFVSSTPSACDCRFSLSRPHHICVCRVIASVETAMGIAARTMDVPACIVQGCWSRKGLRRSIRRWLKLEKSSGVGRRVLPRTPSSKM